MPSESPRYVVWVPGPADWQLGPVYASGCHYGGHRTLHELAVAIAATGRRVEMRGDVDLEELERLSSAAGARPELPNDARRPEASDVVLMPEGNSALTFAQVALSRARVIVVLLAPPGMCGWPFSDGWALESPLTVEIESLARPEQFQAMAALGFEFWTHMPVMAERARAAGVPCAFIGTGRPLPYPEPLPKRYDVVTLANNRWAELARRVASQLDAGVVCHEIPAGTNEEVLRQLGQARVLIHPIRVEGTSRVGLEARAMGAVPVVWDSNPFSVGLDEEGGAVAVSSPEEMPGAVARLLDDPERMRKLAERARRSARAQIDWDAYVTRVDAALSGPALRHPARAAQGVMGDALIEHERQQLAVWRSQAEALTSDQTLINQDREALAAQLEAERAARRAIQDTRAWRLAGRYRRARDSVRRATDRVRTTLEH